MKKKSGKETESRQHPSGVTAGSNLLLKVPILLLLLFSHSRKHLPQFVFIESFGAL